MGHKNSFLLEKIPNKNMWNKSQQKKLFPRSTNFIFKKHLSQGFHCGNRIMKSPVSKIQRDLYKNQINNSSCMRVSKNKFKMKTKFLNIKKELSRNELHKRFKYSRIQLKDNESSKLKKDK